jgi:hypothetical protein
LHLGPYYSAVGRPSIDPELMIRMLIVGYCFGIRSERRLCEEVHLNLAYRWFCRLVSVREDIESLESFVSFNPATRTPPRRRDGCRTASSDFNSASAGLLENSQNYERQPSLPHQKGLSAICRARRSSLKSDPFCRPDPWKSSPEDRLLRYFWAATERP